MPPPPLCISTGDVRKTTTWTRPFLCTTRGTTKKGLKHVESETSGSLALYNVHATRSRYILDHKVCGQKNNRMTGSW